MTDFRLPGLEGSTPLGALAAFGLLRACADLKEQLGVVRLYWEQAPTWKAALQVEAECTPEDLVQALVSRQRLRADAPEFRWGDDIKAPVAEFVRFARQMAMAPESRAAADFAAAFGSDLAAKNSEQVRPTAFHMTSGQQKFLLKARELAAALNPGPDSESPAGGADRRIRKGRQQDQDSRERAARAFHEALVGPWQYQDRQHSFGWDPAAERLHALRSQSPTSEPPLGVRAAVWLAVESLPLFPCSLVGGRLCTGGFDPQGDAFTWPVWTAPLTLETVRSLLLLEELTRPEPLPATLRARGVAAVFRAQRVPLGDRGYAIFRPATLCRMEPGRL